MLSVCCRLHLLHGHSTRRHSFLSFALIVTFFWYRHLWEKICKIFTPFFFCNGNDRWLNAWVLICQILFRCLLKSLSETEFVFDPQALFFVALLQKEAINTDSSSLCFTPPPPPTILPAPIGCSLVAGLCPNCVTAYFIHSPPLIWCYYVSVDNVNNCSANGALVLKACLESHNAALKGILFALQVDGCLVQ